jgi:hypothetical protein
VEIRRNGSQLSTRGRADYFTGAAAVTHIAIQEAQGGKAVE